MSAPDELSPENKKRRKSIFQASLPEKQRSLILEHAITYACANASSESVLF